MSNGEGEGDVTNTEGESVPQMVRGWEMKLTRVKRRTSIGEGERYVINTRGEDVRQMIIKGEEDVTNTRGEVLRQMVRTRR